MRHLITLISSITILSTPALAADVLDSLKKMNIDMCIKMGSNVPDAPKNPKLVQPYCGCVSDSYWQSVPAAEMQELMTRGNSPGIQKNLDARMAAAQGTCKKKLGF